MAKTIHDLAVAYGKEHQGTVDIEIFEAGAKAVLKKVEYHLNKINVYNYTDDDLEDLYDNLCKTVKNLKGE